MPSWSRLWIERQPFVHDKMKQARYLRSHLGRHRGAHKARIRRALPDLSGCPVILVMNYSLTFQSGLSVSSSCPLRFWIFVGVWSPSIRLGLEPDTWPLSPRFCYTCGWNSPVSSCFARRCSWPLAFQMMLSIYLHCPIGSSPSDDSQNLNINVTIRFVKDPLKLTSILSGMVGWSFLHKRVVYTAFPYRRSSSDADACTWL